jgi:hypothetical protein
VDEAQRAQDVGRRHRRRGAPSPATLSLLADYQAAMRAELRATLVELEGKAEPAGLLTIEGAAAARIRPSLGDRVRLWDLAIKLGRELAGEIDPVPPADDAAVAPRRGRTRRVDYR